MALAPIVFPLFGDGTGLPLGTATFYEAGTTTPKNTYTDSAGGTPNDNPLTFDANGFKQVWGSGNYKIVVSNAAATVTYTIDNFNPANFSGSGSNAFAYPSTNTATAGDTVSLGGDSNTATAADAGTFCGRVNEASGQRSVVLGGFVNIASGEDCAVLSGLTNTASGNYSVAHGRGAVASHYAAHAHAAGPFSATGDAQGMFLTLRRQTTNSTPAELFLDGSSLRMAIPTDTTWGFDIMVTARRTDANGESAFYRFEGCIDNNAGTTALVGSVVSATPIEDTAGWACAVTADDTNDALIITVTGENAKTINWVARAHIVQVTG